MTTTDFATEIAKALIATARNPTVAPKDDDVMALLVSTFEPIAVRFRAAVRREAFEEAAKMGDRCAPAFAARLRGLAAKEPT